MEIEPIDQEELIMSWLHTHTKRVRVVVLLLLLVSLLGPWAYNSDGVPPPEWCRAPYLLLDDGRCVEMMSAARILFLVFGLLLTSSAGLLAGAVEPGQWARSILFLLSAFLLTLPFVSTLLFFQWNGEPRYKRLVHTLVWGVTILAGLLFAIFVAGLHPRLWGVWLYTALAIGSLALEVVAEPEFSLLP